MAYVMIAKCGWSGNGSTKSVEVEGQTRKRYGLLNNVTLKAWYGSVLVGLFVEGGGSIAAVPFVLTVDVSDGELSMPFRTSCRRLRKVRLPVSGEPRSKMSTSGTLAVYAGGKLAVIV